MVGGPSVVRPSKSNTELTNSLRANFTSHRAAASSDSNDNSHSTSFRTWTKQQGADLYIPSLDFSTGGLAEERVAYDITVKMFFLPNIPPSRRCQHIKEATSLVLKELHVDSIDLLIISFPGILFDADDESEDEISESTSPSAVSDPTSGGVEDVESMIRTWKTLEKLHDDGTIAKLGLSEFGSQRLSRFLQDVRVKPAVDQINVRDCCVVPKPLIMFAKQEGIELLTHNDCTNILPRGTLRELLGPGDTGMGVLSAPGKISEPGMESLAGDVEPEWVIKYTAVVKDRGVVENKGYFAVAELNEI